MPRSRRARQRRAEPKKEEDKSLKFSSHLSRFILHGLVFVPIIFVSLLAGFRGVDPKILVLTGLFAATSVSLEICWHCLLKKRELIRSLELNLQREQDPTAREWQIGELARTKVHFDWYVILTILTAIGWGLVADCEIDHMKGAEMPDLKVQAAGCFAMFNLLAAFSKLWVITRHEPEPLVPRH